MAESVAMRCATVVRVGGNVHRLRVPLVTADPSAAWAAELSEITHTEADIDEVVEDFHKVAGLTRISNETVADADPSLVSVNGQGLVRDIRRKVDEAFFTSMAPPAPEGIVTRDYTEVPVSSWVDLDPFVEAQVEAETRGARITNWVMHPSTWLDVATLKDASDSNRQLLTGRSVDGIEVLTSEYVYPGTVWGIPRDLVMVGLRQDATLTIDRSRYLEYDAVAVRAILRIAFAFPYEEAIVRITGPGTVSS